MSKRGENAMFENIYLGQKTGGQKTHEMRRKRIGAADVHLPRPRPRGRRRAGLREDAPLPSAGDVLQRHERNENRRTEQRRQATARGNSSG